MSRNYIYILYLYNNKLKAKYFRKCDTTLNYNIDIKEYQ